MQVHSPLKNWKHAHHSRRQSSDNLDSLDSEDSSSVKFNKFNKKSERGAQLSDRKYPSPQPIFVFTGKSREKLAEKSDGKQNQQGEISTSKFCDLFLQTLVSGKQPDFTQNHVTHNYKRAPSLTQRYTPKTNNALNVKLILNSVKTLTLEFRKIIESFSKKYADLKREWDSSFNSLLSLQVTTESRVILELREQLQRKECQLQQIAKISLYKNSINPADAAKYIELQRGMSELEGPLANLAISKIESIADKDGMLNLTRNVTIHELLQHYHIAQPPNKTKETPSLPASTSITSSPPPLLPQVRSMRQTITRMWQILQE